MTRSILRYLVFSSRSNTNYVKDIVEATAILTEVVADMVEEVTSTATQAEVDTPTVVVMEVATEVEPVVIACLTLVLDFRNRIGVSRTLKILNYSLTIISQILQAFQNSRNLSTRRTLTSLLDPKLRSTSSEPYTLSLFKAAMSLNPLRRSTRLASLPTS